MSEEADDGLESLWYPTAKETLLQKMWRSPLSAAALPYRGAVAVRNAAYNRRIIKPRAIEGARVISVGNLNVGGAGKTPVTIFLAQKLLERGQKVAVLSRGYGRLSQSPVSFDAEHPQPPTKAGDEPVLISQRAKGARLMVGANRVNLAQRAVADHGANVLLLDDGMQHRRIARDVDLLVVDEAAAFGNGRMLPRGPLREPLSQVARATVIWLRAAKKKSEGLPKFQQPVIRARHLPKTVIDPEGNAHPAKALNGKKVVLLSAIARPSSFRAAVEAAGAEIVSEFIAEDHHFWELDEVAEAEAAARDKEALLVTTEKDAVKLPPMSDAWVLRIEIEVVSGHEHLEALLAGTLKAR